MMIEETRARTPPTAMPRIRKGSRMSHTIGYRTSARSAIGQQSTKRMHHSKNFTIRFPHKYPGKSNWGKTKIQSRDLNSGCLIPLYNCNKQWGYPCIFRNTLPHICSLGPLLQSSVQRFCACVARSPRTDPNSSRYCVLPLCDGRCQTISSRFRVIVGIQW
jgi:hypothetical protein